MFSEQQLSAYCARIGIDRPQRADADALVAVQAAHRRTIPFENLSVMLGHAVSSDGAAVFDKLVTRRRGGFCFEHNRLLDDALRAMGFTNLLLLARVMLGDPAALPPKTHCLLLVAIDGKPWVADAGFGGAYAPPMRLADGGTAQSDDGARHRLSILPEGDPAGAWLLERLGAEGGTDGRGGADGEWRKQFAFDLAETVDADMAMGCHWAATHPSSRFVNHHVVSRCLPDGFASMVDRRMTLWRAGEEADEREIASAREYREVLEEVFALPLSQEEVERLPLWRKPH